MPASSWSTREQRLYGALKRISVYESAARLHKNAERDYGLSGNEAIECAYENVLQEAKAAIKGMRKPPAALKASSGKAPAAKLGTE